MYIHVYIYIYIYVQYNYIYIHVRVSFRERWANLGLEMKREGGMLAIVAWPLEGVWGFSPRKF